MKSYLALIRNNLRLTYRDRLVLFFNYAFPLVFFFIFAQLNKAERGGVIIQVVTMVLTIGILGSGFFGAGIRAVQDREAGILRRFKVAPISATPMLVSSLVTGLIHFVPSVILVLVLSRLLYGMETPLRPFSLLLFVCLSVLAFRSLGLIIAAVVNSMQESQILIQLLYFPMLFLSGATIPVSMLPSWVQDLAQFLPATYLITGMQGILGRNESLLQNAPAAGALLLTTVLATFIGTKLFRWEKEERIPGRSKLWLLAVLAPFLVLGVWQARSRENVSKARRNEHLMRRGRSYLFHDARIFTGLGNVIETGSVLIRNGKIAEIYSGSAPDPKQLNAEPIEASGKTLLPGLIDVHVHLGSPGGIYDDWKQFNAEKSMRRALASYLYSGITAVKSTGDPLDLSLKTRALVNSGERLGAELFVSGPMFTTPGGHGTEYAKYLPESIRASFEGQIVRLPASAEEARRQVEELQQRGVDGIKAILEAGQSGMLFNRMDVAILRAVAEAARARNLPVVIHTGDARDVADALTAGVNGIEHGSFRDRIPEAQFTRMKEQGVTYDPTLSVVEALRDFASGSTEPLEHPLTLQVGPRALIQSTKKFMASAQAAGIRESLRNAPFTLDAGKQNLLAAYRAGVMLVTGSDAGNLLVIHGPTIHRELQIWVEAGIPPAAALQAATYNAARLLGAAARFGSIQKGREADLLLVDGNPLEDIKRTESIQQIILKGERVNRPDLFEEE